MGQNGGERERERMNPLTWLLHTCKPTMLLILLLIHLLSSTHTANAEIFSTLGERDVVVDLWHSSTQKTTIHERLSSRYSETRGFRTPIRGGADVQTAHIVHGDLNVVCEIWSMGGQKSREFSPTVVPVRFTGEIVKNAYMLRCWLPKGAKEEGVKYGALDRGVRGKRSGKGKKKGKKVVRKKTEGQIKKAKEKKRKQEEEQRKLEETRELMKENWKRKEEEMMRKRREEREKAREEEARREEVMREEARREEERREEERRENTRRRREREEEGDGENTDDGGSTGE